MKTLYATNDPNPIYVDDVDYDLNKYNWYHVTKGKDYFYTNITNNCCVEMVLLHHEIIKRKLNINDIPEGMRVTRLDNNSYNNTRSNLVLATPSQVRQIAKLENGVVKYKGVNMDRNRFRAQLQIPNGKRKFLGNYNTAEEAAYQYNSAAHMFVGDHAYLNELPIVTNIKTGQVVTGKIYNPNYKMHEHFIPKSKYYGVTMNPGKDSEWRARVTRNHKETTIGYHFKSEEDAARAVDNYLISIGEQPRNFI